MLLETCLMFYKDQRVIEKIISKFRIIKWFGGFKFVSATSFHQVSIGTRDLADLNCDLVTQ